jgi:hypothetical protein
MTNSQQMVVSRLGGSKVSTVMTDLVERITISRHEMVISYMDLTHYF